VIDVLLSLPGRSLAVFVCLSANVRVYRLDVGHVCIQVYIFLNYIETLKLWKNMPFSKVIHGCLKTMAEHKAQKVAD